MENDLSSKNEEEDPMIGKLIFDRYKLIKKLGAGSFGSIYSAEYENNYYAIKLEEKKAGYSLLEHESDIMTYLKSPALPMVKAFGYSSVHNILVMELMGKSLEDIFESFLEKKFSVRCVCNIGYQMIEILEYIHNKHIIHRDIKPDNFVIGLKKKKKFIYILDFGLAKKYRSSKTLKHYTVIKSKNLTGTARYASINALNGLTQSRRDDLEAVGYVLLYFLRGRLPWQGIPVRNKEERYRKIMEKKIEISPEELCQGFPMQFAQYINYTRNLKYEENPNYIYLKNLFVSTLNEMGRQVDCYYDWDKEVIVYNRNFNINVKNYETSTASNSHKSQNNNIRDINSVNNFSYRDNRNHSKLNDITNLSTSNNYTNKNITSLTNNDYSIFYTKANEKENSYFETQNKSTQPNIKYNLEMIKEENYPQNENNEKEMDNQKKSKKKPEENGKCCLIF